MSRLIVALLSSALVCLLAASCGLTIPADPEKTLERVTGSTIRVGVSPNPPWTNVGEAGEPRGTEVDLVREFAGTLHAQVEWVVGGEQSLITALEHRELHLVIGGFTSETPWTEKAAITKPYAETLDADGKRTKLVMAAPMGENAFLLALEKFLRGKDLL
jgi:ABC-type amino acid transport substrate-binding protein